MRDVSALRIEHAEDRRTITGTLPERLHDKGGVHQHLEGWAAAVKVKGAEVSGRESERLRGSSRGAETGGAVHSAKTAQKCEAQQEMHADTLTMVLEN